jgi:prepilin-type N-terminal cleavage/methylation domain-containing protein
VGRIGGPGRRDDGVTLAELMVTMSLMAVAGAIGAVAIVPVYQTVNLFQAQTTTAQQLVQSFERLDREVRYATAISQPGTVGTDYYVEYLVGATCAELRLSSSAGQLQRRTWPNGSVTAVTAWVPLASQVSPITGTGAVAPFTLSAATPVLNYERLQVALNSTDGLGPNAASRQSIVTWAAMNASSTPADDVCTEGRQV